MDAIKHNCPCNLLHKTITLLLRHNNNSSFQHAPLSVRVRELYFFIYLYFRRLTRKTDFLTSAFKCFYSSFLNKKKFMVASIVLNTRQPPLWRSSMLVSTPFQNWTSLTSSLQYDFFRILT